jgi:hypothetical protein
VLKLAPRCPEKVRSEELDPGFLFCRRKVSMHSTLKTLFLGSALCLPLACGSQKKSGSASGEALATLTAQTISTEGAVVLKSKDEAFLLPQTIPAGARLRGSLLVPFTIVDSETRQQKWKHCGLFGAELCRDWQNKKQLADQALDKTHVKISLLVNGTEQPVSDLQAEVQYDVTGWVNDKDLSAGSLPLDELLGDPFLAAQKNFKLATGDSRLEVQGRYVSAKGSFTINPNLTALQGEEAQIEVRIQKTSETGVVLIHESEIALIDILE